MSYSTNPEPTALGGDAGTASTRSLVAGGLAASVGAAAATTAIALLGRWAGNSLAVSGEAIPVVGFTTLTIGFSLIGLVLAVVLARTVRRPRVVFVRTTVVLVVLSLVPDVLADASVSTKALLMLAHLTAAAIVIPVVARRLAR